MYTILNQGLVPVGSLTIRSDSKGTKFWGDSIVQQIADDGSNDDPTTTLSMTSNQLDKQANHKMWNHTLTISFDNDSLGSDVVSGYYLTYYDNVMKHYYLMMLTNVEQTPETHTRTATGINSAIYDMAGIYPPAKEFTQATLADILSYVFKYVPWSLKITPNDIKMDYSIDGQQTAQALIQDLQVKFNVEVDAYIELNDSGMVSERIVWVGKLGTNQGALIRSGSQTKGYESMTAQVVGDSFYTKFYITGVTDEADTNAGSITSVNNGLDYIVDDDANRKYNPVGASEGTYREVKLTNTVLKNPTALLDWGKEQAKLLNHPRYNYTVVALHDMVVGLGDNVAIQDKLATPEVNITSRVIQRQISFASPETNVITFGEFGTTNTLGNKAGDVITLIHKDVTVVQEATQNAINQAKIAHDEAVKAQEQAIHAQTSADEKGVVLTVSNFDDLPETADEGTQAWVNASDGTYHYVFIDGDWKEDISPTMQKDITDKVTASLTEAKDYSDKLVADNNTSINNTINEVSQAKIDLALKDADFNGKAQAMADKALSDAKANTTTVAQDTLNSANNNIADAKKSLTDDIAKEVSDRASVVSALDTKAQGYADQAKQDAINAATTADGVINKKIDDTASSISSTISQNKQDAEGKISTAQSTATQALNGLSTKVSQNDYNIKTGQLQTDLTATTQTANQAKTDIVSIKQKDGEQDAKMNTIVSDANGTKQTVSDLQTAQGKQSGDISTLQQRADGFDATVTKVDNLSVGGRNLLIGTNSNDKSSLNSGNGSYTKQYVAFDKGYKYTFSYTTASTNYAVYMFWGLQKGKFIPNTDYVLSFMANVSTDIKPGILFSNGAAQHNFVNQVTSPTILSSNGDQKVVIQLRTNSSIPDESDQALYINGFVNKIGTFSIWDLKIETGNLPTDWTPAPEDVDSATAKAQLTADQATLSINNYKTDADGRISKAQADIVTNANAITQKVSQTDYNAKTGDLTTKVNTAQSTADSATSTIGAYKTSNDARVSSAESKITANANAITQKVSQTDYNQKTGELSGSISTLKQRADGFDATVTKINNLQVGGRNLLLDTAKRTAVGPNVANNTPNAFRWMLANNATVGSLYTAWGKNTPISVSFDWSITGTTIAGAFNPQWNGSPCGIGATGAPGIKVGSTNTSGHYTWSSTTQSGWSSSTANQFTLRTDNLQGTLTITNLKFEQGNLPTDWTPAPEDTDNKISTVSQTVDSISSIVSDPTTGLTKRVQTAEGTLSQVTGADIPNLQKATYWQPYSSLDFNSYTKQGSFFFNTTSAKTNGPVSGNNSWTYLMVEQGTSDNGRIKQTAWYDGVTGVKITYVRTLNSGTWSPWYANDNDSVATISQTNSNIKQEIADRKTGDSNTLQSSKDFTQSSITSAVNGVNSTITQTSDSLIAKINTKTDQQTVLSLLKNNWSIGINDNIGGIVSGIVGNTSQMSLISKKVVIDSPSTQIAGTAWINSAMIAKGAIGTAQIGEAVITSGKIASLDVSKLTGDTITGFNFNVNKSMNIASGGVIKSDVVNMDKTSFTVSTTNGNSKSFITAYNVQTNFSNVNFSIDSASSQMASTGTILAVAGDNTTSSANFETSYAPNNMYFASTNWTGDSSSNGRGSFLRATERSLTLLSGANTVDKADSYTNISSNSIQTKGSIYSDAGIHSGPLYTLGGGAIYTTTGETVYFLNGKAGGRNDIAVKSVSQSSLVSQKTNIGNVDTDYALNEVLKADVRSYNFIDDEKKQIHVSPMIDDVDNKMYIPKDWLDSEHEGVDTYSVIGYLIQAVKELNKKIEQLEQA